MSGITTVGFRRLFFGVSGSAATLSVLLEPLLMAARLVMVLLASSLALNSRVALQGLSMLGLTRTYGSSLVLNKAIGFRPTTKQQEREFVNGGTSARNSLTNPPICLLCADTSAFGWYAIPPTYWESWAFRTRGAGFC